MNLEQLLAKLAVSQNLVQEIAAKQDTADFDKAAFDAAVVEAEMWNDKIAIARTAAAHVPVAPIVAKEVTTEIHNIQTRDPIEQEHADKGNYGFKSGAEFVQAIAYKAMGRNHSAMASVDFAEQTTGFATTREDGIEIPSEYISTVNELAPPIVTELSRFPIGLTARNRVDFIRNEQTPGLTDGLVVYDVAEGAQFTGSRMENEGASYKLHKKGVLAGITSEDLEDLPGLQSRYLQKAPQLIDLALWEDVINGDGVAKTLGFNNANNTGRISVFRQATNLIDFDDLVNLLVRSFKGPGAFWFAGHDTIAQLMKLTNTHGQLIWQDNLSGGVTGNLQHATVMGYPIIFSEDAPKLGAANDITLVDPNGMHLSQKTGGVKFASSIHYYYDTDKEALRWSKRFGGEPIFDGVYSPRNTGSTLSHFVGLAATTS